MHNTATATLLPFDTRPAPQVEATHEEFIQAVRGIVAARVLDRSTRDRLLAAKLVYGGGPAGVRGLCYYDSWHNGTAHDFLEIAALGEENSVQLAGTTIHELAHSLAGRGCGHGPEWKQAATHGHRRHGDPRPLRELPQPLLAREARLTPTRPATQRGHAGAAPRALTRPPAGTFHGAPTRARLLRR